ncbi:MAG: PDR/VanB family oxidoreductase [Proteobacteria bacterium]|nr:PDR/VanB family oxidoreductase [Pseudomonadota bacterium]
MARITATITAVTELGAEIKSFRFQAPAGQPLAGMAPGCHVDLFLPNGLNRQYSPWDWDPAGAWISVGVKRETSGRGGSAWLHDNLSEGGTIELGDIRNNFPLDEAAEASVLIAGGIGVTPMIAMARRLREKGRRFRFYYLARNAGAAGFTEVLAGLGLGDALTRHLDDRDGLFNIKGLIEGLSQSTQVYFCGPEPMLKAVLNATQDWDQGRVRFERFSGDPIAATAPAAGFTVELARSGRSVFVPADKTILNALLEAGIAAEFGCTEGVCGSCEVGYIEGDIEHLDSTMPAEAHDAAQTLCICVSRAKGDKLILDL